MESERREEGQGMYPSTEGGGIEGPDDVWRFFVCDHGWLVQVTLSACNITNLLILRPASVTICDTSANRLTPFKHSL